VEDVFETIERIVRQMDRKMMEALRRIEEETERTLKLLEEIACRYEIRETEDGVEVLIEVPGIPKESIKVWASGNILRVEGCHEDRKVKCTIMLPPTLDVESTTARYRNGLLIVRVPRKRMKEVPIDG